MVKKDQALKQKAIEWIKLIPPGLLIVLALLSIIRNVSYIPGLDVIAFIVAPFLLPTFLCYRQIMRLIKERKKGVDQLYIFLLFFAFIIWSIVALVLQIDFCCDTDLNLPNFVETT